VASSPTESFLDSRDDPDGQPRRAREMPLLLHSLIEFGELIRGLIEATKPKLVIEIGGETGQSAITYLAAGAEEVVCVDPMPTAELTERASNEERLTLVVDHSLKCMPSLPPSGFWVIDGDHNYSTVRAELEAILERASSEEKPLIMLHDVLWPCGRRDLYYDPTVLDDTAVHPHRWDVGPSILSETLEASGLVGSGQFAFATEAGGERNGVRTAIEDVLAARPQLTHAIVPAVFGLGVIYDLSAPWGSEVAELLRPWDRSPLLTRLELNRVSLYSRVLGLQHELERRTQQFERQARELDAQIARLRSERLAQRAEAIGD